MSKWTSIIRQYIFFLSNSLCVYKYLHVFHMDYMLLRVLWFTRHGFCRANTIITDAVRVLQFVSSTEIPKSTRTRRVRSSLKETNRSAVEPQNSDPAIICAEDGFTRNIVPSINYEIAVGSTYGPVWYADEIIVPDADTTTLKFLIGNYVTIVQYAWWQ